MIRGGELSLESAAVARADLQFCSALVSVRLLLCHFHCRITHRSSSSISSSDDMPYSKQAIMIHSLPKGDSSTVSSLLDTLVTQDKVGAIWLSDLNLDEEDIYASLSEGFSDVVAGVDERNSALSTKRRARRAARLQVV